MDLRDPIGEVQVRSSSGSSKSHLGRNVSVLVVKLTFYISIVSQVHDGYFVHYFAPRGLPVVPKDVIFVIDISGSMIGTKIKQVKWTSILS